MGGLKPIGSEKLEGMDKIHRIMEIARYKENIPNSINENQKNEYSLGLADGNTYHIVKERLGYIIKMGLNESTADYIEPMKNRKYFSSYSQALKKLNLMAKEFNVLYENVEGTSLFNEEKKKYKLKLKSSKTPSEPASTSAPAGLGISTPPPVSAPTPVPAALPMTPPSDMGGENKPTDLAPTPSPSGDLPMSDTEEPADLPTPSMDDTSMDKKSMDTEEEPIDTEEEPMDSEEEPMDNEEEPEDKESKGGSSFKLIQKLTGKLAQKIRTYTEDNDIDSKDAKYILNSILSAIDVDSLDEDDVDDIIARLEGEDEDDEETDYDTMDSEEEPVDNEEESFDSDEDTTETEDDIKPMKGSRLDRSSMDMKKPPMKKPSAPSMGELGETMSLSDAINKKVGIEYNSAIQDELGEDMGLDYPKHGARFQRKPRFYDDTENSEFDMFGESKVDKIISQYFDFSKEKTLNEERKRIQLSEQKEKKLQKTKSNISRLSENIKQERLALKFMEKYPSSKLLGKTNKGSLVFEEGFVKTKITINGTII